MNINRRSAIKYFILVTAGTALLPTCKPSPKKITAYNNLPVDEAQQALLAAITVTILPDTTTPGAQQVAAHVFALQMLNDCYAQQDREKFTEGMQAFDKRVKRVYNRSFTECSGEERHAIINDINTAKDAKTAEAWFYHTMKKLTIQAYTGSKYYLTKVQEYKLVPGKFKGSVPVA